MEAGAQGGVRLEGASGLFEGVDERLRGESHAGAQRPAGAANEGLYQRQHPSRHLTTPLDDLKGR